METLKNASMTTLAPHLQVIICDEERVIFSRGVNIGSVEEEIFLVKQEYFTGGVKSTVYTEQDIKVITETLRLKGATTLERIKAIENATIELKEISKKIAKEKDATTANSLLERARALVKEFGNETNVEIGNEILITHTKNFAAAPKKDEGAANSGKGGAEKALARLNEIKALIGEQKTKKAAKALFEEADKILDENDDDPEMEKVYKAIKRKFSNF